MFNFASHLRVRYGVTTGRLFISSFVITGTEAVGSLLTTAVAVGSTVWLVKNRQLISAQNELSISSYKITELEKRLQDYKSLDHHLKESVDEWRQSSRKASDFQRLDSVLQAESQRCSQLKDDLQNAHTKITALENALASTTEKRDFESQRAAEYRGRLEAAQSTVELYADRTRELLQKSIESTVKANMEQIGEQMVQKTREVVGEGVVDTLRSSLKQSTVLGRYGEIQLQYLLSEYFTLGQTKLYDEQVVVDSKKRLDAVLKLPTADSVLHIIVDAKTPNIFPSSETINLKEIKEKLSEAMTVLAKADYVAHYRRHVTARPTSTNEKQRISVYDFVLMFVPMDYALAAVDEKLIRKSFETKIVVCTPSLLALQIEFIKLAWRQKLPSDALIDIQRDFGLLTEALDKLNNDLDKCNTSLNAASTRAQKAIARLKNVLAGVFVDATKSEA